MPRTSIKIVGASGQGINSIGAVVARGLKRRGYNVFGYREYPSLIKGGHASFQLDVSNEALRSSELKVNILIALNHHGLELNMEDLKDEGIVLHVTPDWQFPEHHQKLIEQRNLRVTYLPAYDILSKLGANPVLSNVLMTAALWSMFGLTVETLKSLIGAKFASKPLLAELNLRCVEEGYRYAENSSVTLPLPPRDATLADYLLLTGSEAMGLGAIHAGVRLVAGYPMTPASPLLGFIAELENETHMVVKQAEDEITAAQIVSGAMYAGTRALTATSGAGIDLMSETISLNAMIENPSVFVLAQRPGPSTGLPTWTSQDSLFQAVHAAHGEFAHCVLSVSNSQDAFDLMPVAFNLAERFQITVLVLTERQITEALYTQAPYDLQNAAIDRGKLVIDPAELKSLKSSDRYDPEAKGGISLRWLPGSAAATYCAQSDEHNSMGSVDEGLENRRSQMDKRMRKLDLLKACLPEPDLIGTTAVEGVMAGNAANEPLDMLLVSWGSTNDAIRDVMCSSTLRNRRIASLRYTYLWPLRTERLEQLAKRAARTIVVEQNYQGQLALLIRMQCGLEIADRILKCDGRPFFYDELHSLLLEKFESAPGGIHSDVGNRRQPRDSDTTRSRNPP